MVKKTVEINLKGNSLSELKWHLPRDHTRPCFIMVSHNMGPRHKKGKLIPYRTSKIKSSLTREFIQRLPVTMTKLI